MSKANDRVFFDISIGEGKMVFKLYNVYDRVNIYRKNYQKLAKISGELGIGSYGSPLHYKGCTFHRIIPNFMCQGGDFTMHDGTGGESIYKDVFDDEGFMYKHSKRGILSMANCGENTNGSQFFITSKALPHLDGKHVVFGEVISGLEILDEMEKVKVDKEGKPNKENEVKIVDCGIYKEEKEEKEKEKKSDNKKEEKEEKHHHHHHSHKNKEEEKKEKEDKEKKEREESEKVVVVSSIIIGSDNSKYIPQQSSTTDNKNEKRENDNSNKNKKDNSNSKPIVRKINGHEVKGRGFAKYRSPSRERSPSYRRNSRDNRKRSSKKEYSRSRSNHRSYRDRRNRSRSRSRSDSGRRRRRYSRSRSRSRSRSYSRRHRR